MRLWKKFVGFLSILLAAAMGIGAFIWLNAGDEAIRSQSGEATLPAILQISKPVRAGDLEFQIVASSIWPMPARTSPVRFELRITNRGQQALRVASITGPPILKSADGKEFEVHPYGSDRDCGPTVVSVEAGKTVAAHCFAGLYTRGPKGTFLAWSDEFCGSRGVESLKPGKYLLSLRYDTRQGGAGSWIEWAGLSGVWRGDVQTAEVPVEIVDLKASLPARSAVEPEADGKGDVNHPKDHGRDDPLEIVALADTTWKAPKSGKVTQVCLGFRIATIEKWWVRIVPQLVSVRVKSADGVEFSARKTGATVPIEPSPFLLELYSESDMSLAYPAILFRSGKSLTLAWADGDGNVWHIENLQPGRYSVRCVVQAKEGAPHPNVTYWLGELRSAEIPIEIKE